MPRRRKPDDAFLAELEEIIPRRGHGTHRQTHLSLEDLRKVRNMARHGMFESRIYGVLGIPRSTWDQWKMKGRALLAQVEAGDKRLDEMERNELCYLYIAYTIRVGMPEAIARVEENLRRLAEVQDYRHIRAIELYLRTRDRENYGRSVLEHHLIRDEPDTMSDQRRKELSAYLGDIFEYNGDNEDDPETD